MLFLLVLIALANADCSICPNDNYVTNVQSSKTCTFAATLLGNGESCEDYAMTEAFTTGDNGDCEVSNIEITKENCEAFMTGATYSYLTCDQSADATIQWMNLIDSDCNSNSWKVQREAYEVLGCCADVSVTDCANTWCPDGFNTNDVAVTKCFFSLTKLTNGQPCSDFELDGEDFDTETGEGVCEVEGDFTQSECESVMAGAYYSTTTCKQSADTFNIAYDVSDLTCSEDFPGSAVGMGLILQHYGCCKGGSSSTKDCICKNHSGNLVALATGSASCSDENGGEVQSNGQDVSMQNGFTEAQCTQLGGEWNTHSCGYYDAYIKANPDLCFHGEQFEEYCCGVEKPEFNVPTIPANGGLATLYYYTSSKCSGNPIMVQFEVVAELGVCAPDGDGAWEKTTVGDDCDSYTMNTYSTNDCSGTPTETENGNEDCIVMPEDSEDDSSDGDNVQPNVYRKITINGGSAMACSATDEQPQTEFASTSFLSLTLVLVAAFLNL